MIHTPSIDALVALADEELILRAERALETTPRSVLDRIFPEHRELADLLSIPGLLLGDGTREDIERLLEVVSEARAQRRSLEAVLQEVG